MRDREIYTAGPITGLSYAAARRSWRERIVELLPPHILTRSPMRGKEALMNLTSIGGDAETMTSFGLAIATPKGIVCRDINDIRSVDALVVNLLGAHCVSIGTVAEIGAAYISGKPIILLMEKGDYTINVTDAQFQDIAPKFIVEAGKGTADAAWRVTMRRNPHTHAFVTEMAGYWIETLEEAAVLVTHLLTPGV